eukprot:GHVR01121846.1.p1 GENE.GHVR01121846.1~~GHVR01121846.1.p1  ORF type:complete len:534 (+),score=135.15 GHVR01121846.1:313-1914(+)
MKESVPQCPVGFSFSRKGPSSSDDVCLLELTEPPQYVCPPGYRRTNVMNSCVKQEEQPVTTSCPIDYIKSNDTTDGTIICTKQHFIDPLSVCPSGYNLNDNSICTKEHLVPPTLWCPEGFEPYDDNTCTKQLYAAPHSVCPDTYELVGEECVRVGTAPKKTFCPPDFVLKEDNCVYETNVKGITECPSGTYFDKDTNICKQTEVLSESLVCKDERFKLNEVTGMCVFTREVPPVCPPGFTFSLISLNCEFRQEEQPVAVCPDGGSPPCAPRVTEVLGEFQCPHGSQINGNRCVSVKTETPKDVCPEGYSSHPTETGVCVVKEVTHPHLQCPDEYPQDIHTNRCTSHVSAPARAVCPPGYTPSGHNCVVVKEESVDYRCQDGYTQNDDGACVTVKTAQLLLTCCEGFMLINGKCIIKHTRPVDIVCSTTGFLYDETSKVCRNDRLERPDYTCPVGFERDSEGVCMKLERRDAIRNIIQPKHVKKEPVCICNDTHTHTRTTVRIHSQTLCTAHCIKSIQPARAIFATKVTQGYLH